MSNERHGGPASSDRPVGFEVDFPAALELADIAISCDDLRRARSFLIRLGNLYSNETNFWTDEMLADALWTASIIKYARAFDRRGAKSKKLDASIYKGWAGASEMHQRFIALRNNCTAHDRNPMNQCKVGIDVSPVGETPDMRVCQFEIYPLPSIGEVENLYKLVCSALQCVERLREKQTENVLEQAKRLGMDHLRSRRILTLRAAVHDQGIRENRVGWPREKSRK